MTIRKYVCKRCSTKFFNNTKFYQHIQNYHQKKSIKFADEIAKITTNEIAKFISNEFVKITTNEFAKITSIAIFATISTFFSTSKTIITMFTSFATFISNESILMFTLHIKHQESIFDILFLSISIVTSKQSTFTSFEISKKSIF